MDDVWSAGYVGLYRGPGGSSAQLFDDVTVFIDNDSDGMLDAADDVQLSDDFASNVMSLTYDNNGNLTDDGVLRYVYDAWNRLRKANRYESTSQDTTTIGAYEYYADNRRSEKAVTSCGVEETAGDGGNTTVRYYYANQSPDRQGGVAWSICETRNGSNQATRQWVWGTQYVDEPVLMDVNGDPTESNDCNPDDQAGESTADERYFYVQDRNWNVVALTSYDPTGEGGADLVERYSYTPYGEFIVLKAGATELGNVLPTSTVGNPFAHQGLPFDSEKGSHHGGGPDAYVAQQAQSQPSTQPTTQATQPCTQPTPPTTQSQPSEDECWCPCSDELAAVVNNEFVLKAIECGGYRCTICINDPEAGYGSYNAKTGCITINCASPGDHGERLVHEAIHAIQDCCRIPPVPGGGEVEDMICKRCLAREMMANKESGRCNNAEDCRNFAQGSCGPQEYGGSGQCTFAQMARLQQWAVDYYDNNSSGWRDDLLNCQVAKSPTSTSVPASQP